MQNRWLHNFEAPTQHVSYKFDQTHNETYARLYDDWDWRTYELKIGIFRHNISPFSSLRYQLAFPRWPCVGTSCDTWEANAVLICMWISELDMSQGMVIGASFLQISEKLIALCYSDGDEGWARKTLYHCQRVRHERYRPLYKRGIRDSGRWARNKWLISVQSRQKEEAARKWCGQVPYISSKNGSKYSSDLVGNQPRNIIEILWG